MKATLRRGMLAGVAAALLATPATAGAAVSVEPPMSLPGDAAAASANADHSTWLVGAHPSAASRAIAARFGARPVGVAGTGGYALPTGKARAFAAALRERGLLIYAQPNTTGRFLNVPDDPLSVPPDAWRRVVADPTLTPPPVTPASPLIALVDAQLDPTAPEFQAGGSNITTIARFPVTIEHGTATASVAAAPANGRGIIGVWPGARALNVPLPDTITCQSSANAIAEAIGHGAAVINMSYGSAGFCMPEYIAIQKAVALGIIPVAAAGNEREDGNPLEFPGALPHVITAAAIDARGRGTGFSNANAAVDLSAPGVGIMTAVPLKFDKEAPADGYEHQSGTSFSSPMIAAAAAWLREARPQFTGAEVAQAIRLSAIDVGQPGWEADTGFGVLSVGRALQVQHPPKDTPEPNDDISWVNGRQLGTPATPIFNGKGHARRSGLLDIFEDPADVYRIKVRGHHKVHIKARPSGRRDDIALRVYRKNATRLRSKPFRKSAHKGHKTERVLLRNTGRRPKIYYVALSVQGTKILDATYTLRVG